MQSKGFRLNADASAIVYLVAFTLYALASVLCTLLEGDAAIYVGYAVPQLVFVCAIAAFIVFKGVKVNDVVCITAKKPNPIALALCVPLTIGVMMQNMFFSYGFSWAMVAAGVEMSVTVPAMDTAPRIILAIVVLAILPAIGEESMYRGLWLNGIKNSMGQKCAIVLSAIIFSLSHLNPAQLVHQFLLGVILAYIATEAGSVVYGMVIHFLNNTLALVLPKIIPAIDNLSVYSWQNLLILIAVSVVGAGILYPTLYFTMKKINTNGHTDIFKYLFAKKSPSDVEESSGSGEKTNGMWGFISKIGFWTIATMVILIILSVVTIFTKVG